MLHLNPCHGNGRLQGTAQQLTLCWLGPPSSMCFDWRSHACEGMSENGNLTLAGGAVHCSWLR